MKILWLIGYVVAETPDLSFAWGLALLGAAIWDLVFSG